MNITIKHLDGTFMNVKLDSNASVSDLKREIENLEHLPTYSQRLLFNTKELSDEETLASYNIGELSCIDLNVEVLGGYGSYMSDYVKDLAQLYVIRKKICRKCYTRLPYDAYKCRNNTSCNNTDLRLKHSLRNKKLNKDPLTQNGIAIKKSLKLYKVNFNINE